MRTLAISLLAAALCVSGCSKKSTSTRNTLVFGRGADATLLDPADITDGESVKVCNQIYETLVTYGEKDASLVPCLAESWETSEEARVWTFHLRKNVRFHDDTPFDAASVVFTFQRHLDPDNAYRFDGKFAYSSNYGEIEKVEAEDDHTVVFTLSAPSAVFLANLAMFPAGIVSPAAVKKFGEKFGQNPVGTGPFRFVEWVRDEKIVLEANPEWWGGETFLKRVIFKPVSQNAARLEQLSRGEIHVMDNFSLSDVKTIEKEESLAVERVTGMNFAYLSMNNQMAPFDKVEVRRAVAHALDKAKILQLGVFGYGATGPNPMPPSVWGYNEGVKEYAQDPDKARALLEEAGLEGGFDTELWVMPNPRPYMPRPKEVAQIIKENLAAVGIRAKIVSHPWTSYLEKVQNGEHPMCLLGWTTDNGDPDNFLWQLLHKSNAVKGSAQNVSFYRSDEVSDLLDRAQHEMSERDRMHLYQSAQERIHEDCPMIPLLYLPQMAAYRKEVKGYVVHPIGIIRLAKVRLGD